MKRSDMQVGEEYAVLSPSQRTNLRNRWAPNAKRVRVLDTQPKWHDGGYRSYRAEYPSVSAVGFEEDGQVEAVDYVGGQVSDYRLADAKRVVKVLTADEAPRWRDLKDDEPAYTRYHVTTVPISQVAMPWAEYVAIRAEVADEQRALDRARERSEAALKAARKDREARRDQLNNLLAATPFRAKVLDGEVAIVGPAADMGDLAGLAADMVADTAELGG